jgi:hypothetical protein
MENKITGILVMSAGYDGLGGLGIQIGDNTKKTICDLDTKLAHVTIQGKALRFGYMCPLIDGSTIQIVFNISDYYPADTEIPDRSVIRSIQIVDAIIW